MAKKEVAKEDAIEVRPNMFVLPAFMKQEDLGDRAEFEREDVRIPRLTIAQALSPQLTEDDPLYIEGLTFGDIFNDLTGDNYGRGPVKIIVVRVDRPRYVEFSPREEGGGVIDPDVPAGDPRTQFTTDANGKRVKPVATKFLDYVVLVVGENGELEPMAISLKGSGLRTAQVLNGLITNVKAPLYGVMYELRPILKKSDVGKWYVFSVRQAGFVSDEQMYLAAQSAYRTWAEKKVVFDMSEEPDPVQEEAEQHEGGM